MVRPAQITLPASPLQIATTPAVTIQNNSINPITVSSPEVNLPGVRQKSANCSQAVSSPRSLHFPRGLSCRRDKMACSR